MASSSRQAAAARTSHPEPHLSSLQGSLREQDSQQPPRAEPEDIFYQIDQELKYIEDDLAAYFAATNSSAYDAKGKKHNDRDHPLPSPFPRRQIQALLQLKQFSPLFRPLYKELLARLPIPISVRPRKTEFGVAMTSPVDIPSTQYARFRCAYAFDDASQGATTAVQHQCETWTFKPYVTDTFLLGLTRILNAAADTRLEGNALEAQLGSGCRDMFCSAHEESLKHERACAFGIAARKVVEAWREDVSRWLGESGGSSMTDDQEMTG